MPLTNLAVDHTEVTELSPLADCLELKTLDCRGTKKLYVRPSRRGLQKKSAQLQNRMRCGGEEVMSAE